MTDKALRVWICGYSMGDAPVSADTLSAIMELTASCFYMDKALASFGTEKPAMVHDAKEWFKHSLQKQRAALPVRNQVSLSSVARNEGGWSLESYINCQYKHGNMFAGDPRFLLGIDLALASSPGSIDSYLKQVAIAMLKDQHIWYGFIDVSPRSHVWHPSYYSGEWPEGIGSWERYVEMSYWQDHALGTRDRVRGVFWGNILGPIFAERLLKAGYVAQVTWLREEWQCEPVAITDESTGSMAVFLDDDPVSFAKTRDIGLETGSTSGAIHTGGMLQDVLSRARLL